MNQDDVEAVVQGETRRFRPLHELLDMPVETSEEAMCRMMRQLEENVTKKNAAKGGRDG